MKKTFLIFGGAGFIGANAADYFLGEGHGVIIFDNFARAGSEKNIVWLKTKYPDGDRLKVVRGDVTLKQDFSKMQALVEQVDHVLHLAAQVAVTTSVIDPRSDFENNLLGTFNVLESIRLSRRRPSLIFTSTNKVYGDLAGVAVIEKANRYDFRDIAGVNEEQLLDFHSPYGCSKGASDQYVRDYARIYGLKTVVCRQSCIYGSRQFGMEDQGWVAWFIIAVTMAKRITIYGNGKQVRDLLYASDLVKLYDQLFVSMDKVSGRIFNIGGGPENTLSLLEFIDILEKKIGHKLDYQIGGVRPGDQPIYISDIKLIEKLIGWRPKVSVERGLNLLWDWVQENKALFS